MHSRRSPPLISTMVKASAVFFLPLSFPPERNLFRSFPLLPRHAEAGVSSFLSHLFGSFFSEGQADPRLPLIEDHFPSLCETVPVILNSHSLVSRQTRGGSFFRRFRNLPPDPDVRFLGPLVKRRIVPFSVPDALRRRFLVGVDPSSSPFSPPWFISRLGHHPSFLNSLFYLLSPFLRIGIWTAMFLSLRTFGDPF